MSYEEALKSWEKIFILVMENTDDPVYKKAEEIINKESTQNLIKHLIEEEVYLPCNRRIYSYDDCRSSRPGEIEEP